MDTFTKLATPPKPNHNLHKQLIFGQSLKTGQYLLNQEFKNKNVLLNGM